MAEVKRKQTLADIEALPENVRAELINGEMYMLAAPTIQHQEIVGELYAEIRSYIKNKGGSCTPLVSPIGVVLRDEKSGSENYFEPDLVVVCDPEKLSNGKRCEGAPDWIIEVTSPSTRRNDYGTKAYFYMQAGVKEYWIVDIQKKMVIVHSAADDWGIMVYPFGHQIPVGIYQDLKLTL